MSFALVFAYFRGFRRATFFLWCLLVGPCAGAAQPTRADRLLIRSMQRVLPPAATVCRDLTSAEVAGFFSNQFTVDPPSDHLYLLPNGNYLYAQSGDVMPFQIVERGKWSCQGSILSLRKSATSDYVRFFDRQYLAFFYAEKGADTLFLLGTNKRLSFLRKTSLSPADVMNLKRISFMRRQRIQRSDLKATIDEIRNKLQRARR